MSFKLVDIIGDIKKIENKYLIFSCLYISIIGILIILNIVNYFIIFFPRLTINIISGIISLCLFISIIYNKYRFKYKSYLLYNDDVIENFVIDRDKYIEFIFDKKKNKKFKLNYQIIYNTQINIPIIDFNKNIILVPFDKEIKNFSLKLNIDIKDFIKVKKKNNFKIFIIFYIVISLIVLVTVRNLFIIWFYLIPIFILFYIFYLFSIDGIYKNYELNKIESISLGNLVYIEDNKFYLKDENGNIRIIELQEYEINRDISCEEIILDIENKIIY